MTSKFKMMKNIPTNLKSEILEDHHNRRQRFSDKQNLHADLTEKFSTTRNSSRSKGRSMSPIRIKTMSPMIAKPVHSTPVQVQAPVLHSILRKPTELAPRPRGGRRDSQPIDFTISFQRRNRPHGVSAEQLLHSESMPDLPKEATTVRVVRRTRSTSIDDADEPVPEADHHPVKPNQHQLPDFGVCAQLLFTNKGKADVKFYKVPLISEAPRPIVNPALVKHRRQTRSASPTRPQMERSFSLSSMNVQFDHDIPRMNSAAGIAA